MKYLLLYSITLLLYGQVCAQPYQTTEYKLQILGRDKGFEKATYMSAYQDGNGFLWFSTQRGLFRFSGSYKEKFRQGLPNSEGFLAEYFYMSTEDIGGNLWIASRNGLTYMDHLRKNTQTFLLTESPNLSTINNRLFNIAFINDSILFVAADRAGIISFNIHDKTFKEVSPIWDMEPPDPFWVREYICVSDSLIILRTVNKLYAYNPISSRIASIESADSLLPASIQMNNVFKDQNSVVWFTGNQGQIYQWKPGESLLSIGNPDQRNAGGIVRKLFHDFDQDHILYSTTNGNYLIERKSLSLKKLLFQSDGNEDFSNHIINAAIQTHDLGIFLAFGNGILAMINPLELPANYHLLTKSPQSSPIFASLIWEDPVFHKRYIPNFRDSVIYVHDLQNDRLSTIQKISLGRHSSNRILLDSQERLWVCQNNGMLLIDRENQKTQHFEPSSPARSLFDIAEIRPGVFILGSFNNGLFRFEPNKNVFEKIPETKGLISTQVFCLHYHQERDVLWIGTVRNGVIKYDVKNEHFTQFLPDMSNPNSIGGDWVRSITIDSLGYVWMSVDPQGLARFDYDAPEGKQFLNFSPDQGLPSSHIGGMITDKNGQLWLTSMGGLTVFNPQSFQLVNFPFFDHQHNFYYNNLSVNHKNELLIGSDRGYWEFRPDEIITESATPKICLLDFSHYGRNMKAQSHLHDLEKLVFKNTQNHIRIEFAILDFVKAHKNEVFYNISERDDEWQWLSSGNVIDFPNFSPGFYHFRMRIKQDEQWIGDELSINFRIKPPFQKTWGFFFLVLVLVLGLAYLIFRYRLRYHLRFQNLQTEKKIIKSELEKELAHLEMTALRSQMNPHFIFNCLNAINRFILVNENEAASEYLAKFSKLIRWVLDNSRNEKIKLERELETLELYIQMEKLRFADRFEFELQIMPEVNLQSIDIQPMLIQPYIENAIWHGLMHKNEKGRIELFLSTKEDFLYIAIKDNGIGRKKSLALKSKSEFQTRSHGMKITAERIRLLNTRLNQKSDVKITDLYDQNNKACGTLVELWLPIQ